MIYEFDNEQVKPKVYDGIVKREWFQDDPTINRMIQIFQIPNSLNDAKHIEKKVLIIKLFKKMAENYDNLPELQRKFLSDVLFHIVNK